MFDQKGRSQGDEPMMPDQYRPKHPDPPKRIIAASAPLFASFAILPVV